MKTADPHPPLELAVAERLARHDAVRIAWLFGSAARGKLRPESDLDVAVAGRHPLSGPERTELVEALAEVSGRPVDLVDLRRAGPVVRRQVLIGGTLLFDREPGLLGELYVRLLADETDFLPYVQRIQRAQIDRLEQGPG